MLRSLKQYQVLRSRLRSLRLDRLLRSRLKFFRLFRHREVLRVHIRRTTQPSCIPSITYIKRGKGHDDQWTCTGSQAPAQDRKGVSEELKRLSRITHVQSVVVVVVVAVVAAAAVVGGWWS